MPGCQDVHARLVMTGRCLGGCSRRAAFEQRPQAVPGESLANCGRHGPSYGSRVR